MKWNDPKAGVCFTPRKVLFMTECANVITLLDPNKVYSIA